MKNDIEQRLKESLQKPFVNAKTFLMDIIFPVFGEEKFVDNGMYEVLRTRQELKSKAGASGIISIKGVGSLMVEGSQLDIFDITLDTKKQLQRNRVEIQQIIRSIISTHSGAFIIFHYQSGAKWEWRFTFCHKGASQLDASDAKRYTFLLGPGQSCRTAAENFMKIHEKIESEGEFEMEDIIKAFDVEALSKEFFGKYKEQYEKFCNYIYNNRNDETKFGSFFASCEDKIIRDYVKKLLGRLVFLQFLQKKGWLGASSCEWNDGDKDFLQHLFENASKEQKDDFLDTVLEPMFENALDGNRAATNYDYDTGVKGFRNVKIPYLNGGLYSKDAGIDDAKSVFPASYFEELLTFFYQYNFTIDENDPNDAEVGIDPEMLGRIFENLLEDNKDKGAFYTPKPIVQYMCKESLIAYLQNGCSTDRAKKAARAFVETHDAAPLRELHMEKNGKKTNESVLDFFDKMLKNVKICDPAIGSGAFPMGLLRELYACRSAIEDFETATPAEIKKEIIQNNIYGVDIEKGAVDIARLRFWLSLILDEEDPKALPNLDFKIMQGNSLLESFYGVDLSNIAVGKQKATTGLKTKSRHLQSSVFYFDGAQAQIEIQESIRRYFATENHSVKKILHSKIENAVRLYILQATEDHPELQDKIELLPLTNDIFFLWHTFFADVFADGGFDIVIGNPPYIQLQADDGFLSNQYKDCKFETFTSTGDIYCLFYEQGYNLLKEKGHLCFITSNKWMRTAYGKKTRNFFAKKTNPLLVIDFGSVDIFETATVVTNILLFQKKENEGKTICCSTDKQSKRILSDLSRYVGKYSSIIPFMNNEPWSIISPQELSIKKKMEMKGVAIKESSLTINYGVKTGYNDAFIISTETRNAILANCKNQEELNQSSKIICKIVRGRDIARYNYNWADLWVIHFHNGIKGKYPPLCIDDYPAIKKHLDLYYKHLCERSDKGVTPYNLRNCAYIEEFDHPKIVWGNLNLSPSYTFLPAGVVVNAPSPFIATEDLVLLAILNSKLGDFYIRQIGVTRNGGYFEYKPMFVEQLPIIQVNKKTRATIESIVNRILDLKIVNPRANTNAEEKEIDYLVYALYDLTYEEVKIVEPSFEMTEEEYNIFKQEYNNK